MSNMRLWGLHWFPRRRFDADFPLPLWFAGLWFYLKSFLYLCYVYMLGLDPPPYSDWIKFEVAYFGLLMIPCLLLGLAMWNEKKRFTWAAILFLGIDTPILFFHVLRLASAGFLDAGLTSVLEFGSLALNIIAFVWLMSSYSKLTEEPLQKPAR